MLIFGYTDYEDDRLQVETRESGDFLAFRIPEDRDNHMEARGVDVPRSEALRLYSALGEWLYPVHTPEGPNRSLIEELIAKAVREQVAAVLPLHLASVAVQAPQTEQCRGGYGCDVLGVHAAYGSGCGRPDPEPREVGRFETSRPCDGTLERGQRLSDVHEACGFLWALHKVMAPADEPEPEHGRLMADLPRRPTVAPKCLDCLHGWGEHMGGICWGESGPDSQGDGCKCTRERPGAVSAGAAPKVECTCAHPRVALHNHLGCVDRGCTCRWTGAGTAPKVGCTCPENALHPHDATGCMHPSCTCKRVRP